MLLGFGRADHPPGHGFAREPGFAHWTLAVAHRGRGTLTTAAGTAAVMPGHLVVIRPRTAYRIDLPVGGSETWVILSPPPNWEQLLAWPEALPGLALVPAGSPHGEDARAAFVEAATWWLGGSPQRGALALNALERCLLLLALDRPGSAWAELHPAVRAAVELLAPGPAEPLSVAAVARRVGCSPSHLAHRFRAEVGEALLSWLEGRRLARVQQLLLHTDWPVKRIAADCGFADGEHLARRFRARIGCSPAAWRRCPDGGR
jgi:AraC-like DNA-binding protein